MARCSPHTWRVSWGDFSNETSWLPIGCKHKFHDNKKVTNSFLWETEHRSPDWQPLVVTTMWLAYTSLLVLLSADIQLQILKWPWAHFNFLRLCKTRLFFQALQPLPIVANSPSNIKVNHHQLNWPSFTTILLEDQRTSLPPLGSLLVFTKGLLPSATPGAQKTDPSTS